MDFLVSPLGWKNCFLLASALINLSMAIFIFSRGVKKSKINLYFSLLTFFCFLWGLSVFIARTGLVLSYSTFFAYFAYIAALGIGVSLFYFTLNFPYKIKDLNNISKYSLWVLGLIFSTLVYVKNWFIIGTSRDILNTEYTLYHNKPVYIAYAVYFIFIILCALYFLWLKYKISEGVIKKQLKLLLLSIFIGLIFGTYFDLFICYFGDFSNVWIGPIFTLFMNAAAFYLIFSNRKQ